jgi:uncharacterized protein YukJ
MEFNSALVNEIVGGSFLHEDDGSDDESLDFGINNNSNDGDVSGQEDSNNTVYYLIEENFDRLLTKSVEELKVEALRNISIITRREVGVSIRSFDDVIIVPNRMLDEIREQVGNKFT